MNRFSRLEAGDSRFSVCWQPIRGRKQQLSRKLDGPTEHIVKPNIELDEIERGKRRMESRSSAGLVCGTRLSFPCLRSRGAEPLTPPDRVTRFPASPQIQHSPSIILILRTSTEILKVKPTKKEKKKVYSVLSMTCSYNAQNI